MSNVLVRVPAVLRPFAGNADVLRVEAGTLAHVLEQLRARHPQLVPRVLTPDGRLRPFVNLFVDRTNARALQGLATVVPAGAVVSILPAVAGG